MPIVVHLDPGKVDAVHAPCQHPQTSPELQEFLGLVTYLGPFIPGLSTLTAHPCRAAQEGHRIQYGTAHTNDTAFEQIKEAVISDTTLRYFNPSLPMTIHRLMPHR